MRTSSPPDRSQSLTKVTVIGAGAIGGWVAARLALAGTRVTALTRSGPLETLRLTANGQSETARFAGPDGPADLVILAVKATALNSALPATQAALGPQSLLLPLLNGVPWWFEATPLHSLDPDGRIAEAFASTRILGSVVHASARREADGSVRLIHADGVRIGPAIRTDPANADAVTALLTHAGVPAVASPEIRRDIWYKLWGNATMNPLSALTGATADRILASPGLRPVILAAMAELAALGAAIGCPIAESGDTRMAVTARLGAFKTSMLQDVEAGRPIELEALLGAPRELARRAGIATPTLDQLDATTRLMAETRGLL